MIITLRYKLIQGPKYQEKSELYYACTYIFPLLNCSLLYKTIFLLKSHLPKLMYHSTAAIFWLIFIVTKLKYFTDILYFTSEQTNQFKPTTKAHSQC
jgi:hypothetical protein